MKQRAAVVVVSMGLLGSICAARAQQTSPVGIWRLSKIHWVYAPKELGRSERSGGSGILRFSPDGSFTFVYDAIIQQDGSEDASEGDPWTIYQGTWRLRDRAIEVSYSLIYRDISLVQDGEVTYGRPKLVTEELFWRGRRLVFGEQIYQRSPKLAASFDKIFSQPPHVPPLKAAGPS